MSAALSLVPSIDQDELDQLEMAVEVGLTAAVDSLARLRALNAHRQRGYDLWHVYCLDRFGDLLRLLRLPEGERLALVESMSTPTAQHRNGMPVRAQAERLGVSPGTVQTDKRVLGLAPERQPRKRPEPLPAPTGHVYQQAAEWLRRQPAGLTLVELARVSGWTEGKASGALTDVVRRGLAVRLEDRRAGQRVHVAVQPADD